MTAGCRDSDTIPKVAQAGRIRRGPDGAMVQVMHEGTLVLAGGYHGDWMSEIIRRLRGHHEPQEELLFHHLLQACAAGTLMIEVGAFWAYYTAWWLGAVPNSRAVCVEPDENNRKIGERNLLLNGRSATWISALVGSTYQESLSFCRESDGASVQLPSHTLESLLEKLGRPKVEMLHIDCQGAEVDFLRSLPRAVSEGLLRFVVVSTHHESISGSATTHGDCMRLLMDAGGVILAEHSVDESYSGDGLIVASFLASDREIRLPELSRNRRLESLFGFDNPQKEQLLLTPTDNGLMLVAADDECIGVSLRNNGAFEEALLLDVVRYLSRERGFRPTLFVDIGANIGTHLLRALAGGLFGRGIAIEMDSFNYNLLVSNVALNGYTERTTLYKVALSDAECELTMELSGGNRGDHRLRGEGSESNGGPEEYGESQRKTCRVRATTLDKIAKESMEDFGSGTLVWMDVQGFEGHVLDGARELLSEREGPVFVVELWPYGLRRTGGLERLKQFLVNCRAVHDIRAEGWERRSLDVTGIEALIERLSQSEDSGAHTDLLCIP
jgi:FkbM family methyltransferase